MASTSAAASLGSAQWTVTFVCNGIRTAKCSSTIAHGVQASRVTTTTTTIIFGPQHKERIRHSCWCPHHLHQLETMRPLPFRTTANDLHKGRIHLTSSKNLSSTWSSSRTSSSRPPGSTSTELRPAPCFLLRPQNTLLCARQRTAGRRRWRRWSHGNKTTRSRKRRSCHSCHNHIKLHSLHVTRKKRWSFPRFLLQDFLLSQTTTHFLSTERPSHHHLFWSPSHSEKKKVFQKITTASK